MFLLGSKVLIWTHLGSGASEASHYISGDVQDDHLLCLPSIERE